MTEDARAVGTVKNHKLSAFQVTWSHSSIGEIQLCPMAAHPPTCSNMTMFGLIYRQKVAISNSPKYTEAEILT